MMDASKINPQLSPAQYDICFRKGTEPPGSGKYYKHFEPGVYKCVNCGQDLFRSSSKFKSQSGWPSFFSPVSKEAIKESQDNSHNMNRTEVLCSRCNAHLGHVFTDGPKPTGLRYCINSLALEFESQDTLSSQE